MSTEIKNKEYKYSELIARFYDPVYDKLLKKDGLIQKEFVIVCEK